MDDTKKAPSAKEATKAILEALRIKTPPAEAILIEMYLETAFLRHRREEYVSTHENYLKMVKKNQDK
tara:strand:- start:2355 stop:2555 length:201 start_codon:yes stop_codon:yes gene_type:complete